MGVGVTTTRWFKYTKEFPPAKQFSELLDYAQTFAKKNAILVIIAIMGGGIAMTSVLIGDSIARQPCIEACKNNGWKRGRLR